MIESITLTFDDTTYKLDLDSQINIITGKNHTNKSKLLEMIKLTVRDIIKSSEPSFPYDCKFTSLPKHILHLTSPSQMDITELIGKPSHVKTPHKTIVDLLLDNTLSKVNLSSVPYEIISGYIPDFNPKDIHTYSTGEKLLLNLLLMAATTGKERTLMLLDCVDGEFHPNWLDDWQNNLLESILKINPNTQIVMVTHSTEIARYWSDYTCDIKRLVQ